MTSGDRKVTVGRKVTVFSLQDPSKGYVGEGVVDG